jgi:hypothetical protein
MGGRVESMENQKWKYEEINDMSSEDGNLIDLCDKIDLVATENSEQSQSTPVDETSGDDMDFGPDSWEDEIDGWLIPHVSGSWSWLEL